MTQFSTDISIQRDWIARKGNDNNVTINLTSGGSAFNVATYTGALYVFRLGADYNNLANAVISKTQGSGLTNGGAAGTWAAVITAANLSALQPDQYFWKFQVTHPDATVHDWFNGQFTLQNERYVGDVSTTVTGEINVGGTTIDATITASGGGVWGSITGTLSNQTDLNTALGTKQATLVSGTSIKTVNSTSLLGSGDVAVQATLVSGTNIKTINGSSILGSGDLVVSGGGVSGLTATRVPYAQDATTLIDSASLTWDNTNAALTVRSQRILDKGTNGAKGIFIGYNTGNTTAMTTPDGFNVGFGYSVLPALTNAANSYDASYNTAVGYEAGLSATSGASNTLIGYRAGRAITTGLGNTAVGKDCLRSVATSGSNNTAVGYLCLDQMTGSENTGVGSSCLSGAGSGTRNVGVGYICLSAVTNGSNNVGVGSEVFEFITTQGNNTGVGFWAGVYNKGSNNVAIGAYAMGQATLNSTNDASYNTIVGPSAGSFIAVGDYNTWIGYLSGTAGTGEDYDNTIAIGKGAKVTQSNSCVIGSKVDADRVSYGWGGENYGGGVGVHYIKNAITNASSAGTDGIIIHSKDSSGGSANATLALYLEEAPEATASFTQSHRLKIWINGTEYYLSLDAV